MSNRAVDPRPDAQADPEPLNPKDAGRRALLQALASGAGYALVRIAIPATWSAPLVASMSLPAHAQASKPRTPTASELTCAGATPPAGSAQDANASVSLAPQSKGSTVALALKLPASVVSNRTTVLLCEKTAETGVAATLLPSASNALSGELTHTLTRAPGTYEYQLRWGAGHSAWFKVEVK